MATKMPTREKRKLVYRQGSCEPEEWLRFIQLPLFERGWSDLRLDDDDLRGLEVAIMANPERSPPLKGTGGLRKIRFAPARWNIGASGAARICYVFFPKRGMIILITTYRKNKKENLTNKDKAEIKKLIEEIESCLENGRSF